MAFSRRNFIKIGGLSALALIAAPTAPLFGAAPKDRKFDVLAQMSLEDFRNQIGSRFYLTGEEYGIIEAVLSEVINHQTGKKSGECFSLVFKLPGGGAAKPQATYDVVHSRLGNFSLLLVPGRSASGTHSLIAEFNRL